MDHRGQIVTDIDVLDQPALVYFGYTFCPDACPMDVARNVVAVEVLADSGLQVKPVFITIDPARDTPEYLADFVANNHPDMVGLTGTAEQVAQAARAYKVYYRKQLGDDEEYYLMDLRLEIEHRSLDLVLPQISQTLHFLLKLCSS